MQYLKQISDVMAEQPVGEALQALARLFPESIVFSTSLGQEDQVLTDIIARHPSDIRIFTLDTGRLFYEHYDLLEKTEARYKTKIQVYFPQATAVESMVNEKGVNLFYESVESRKQCCHVRKVEPLNRALQGAKIWITGLRSGQTELRKDLPVVEWLEEKQLYKINPLLHWSYEDILEYIKEHNVPYNPLHDQGFISIGCAPCTRAIEPGEDPRAGRWWWEQTQKECGLHLVK